MKNLLIYTGVQKKFGEEDYQLAKIQVDNSLDLGWDKKDILFVTDFPFEYDGFKSIVIDDGYFYKFDPTSNKIPVFIHLIERKIINPGDFVWYHDFDVFQQEIIRQEELLLNGVPLGITPYGYKPEWNLGSIFFTDQALDIFRQIDENILTKRKSDNRCDEKALRRLILERKIKQGRYKDLNVTYNLTKRCIATNYRNAEKPIKVLHFRPSNKDEMMNDTALNIFMYGKNRLKMPLMTPRLIKIFQQHGIK